MSVSISEALQLMDAADPAADVKPAARTDGAWRDLVESRDEAVFVEVERPQRRATRVVLVAACVLAVLCAAVASLVISGSGTGGREHSGQETPSYPTSKDEAINLINGLLDQFPRLRQAQPLLGVHFTSKIGCGPDSRCITLSRTVAAPGTVKSTAAYYLAHLPNGWRRAENRSASQTGVAVLLVRAPNSTDAFGMLEVVPFKSGVAIRVSIATEWFSTKTAAENIGTVDSAQATVRYLRQSGQGTTRTLTTTQAQALADLINAAPLSTPEMATQTCVNGPRTAQYSLTMHVGAVRYVVYEPGNFCSIDLSVNGIEQPGLYLPIGPPLLVALGLPAK